MSLIGWISSTGAWHPPSPVNPSDTLLVNLRNKILWLEICRLTCVGTVNIHSAWSARLLLWYTTPPRPVRLFKGADPRGGTSNDNKSADHSRTAEFFWIPYTHLPLWEMSGGVRGKEHEWSYKTQDGKELKTECLGMTWSENVENRHWCFQNDHAHHMLQMVWKCNCTDSSRSRTKWFCRWIVVCFVCERKFVCLLVRVCKGIMFGWQPSPLSSYQCFWDVITGLLLQDRTRDAVV